MRLPVGYVLDVDMAVIYASLAEPGLANHQVMIITVAGSCGKRSSHELRRPGSARPACAFLRADAGERVSCSWS